MNKLLREFISYILNEYTDDERKRMGIPPNAVARGKFWYDGTGEDAKYLGIVKGGKFIPAQPGEKPPSGGKAKGEPPPSATKQPRQPKPSKPSADKAPAYGSKSAVGAGLISSVGSHPGGLTDSEGNPLQVRSVIREDGTSIDTSTPEGRAEAVTRIDQQIKSLLPTTLQACENFTGDLLAQKWLGEIGELHALKEILVAGREAYLASDSNPESDILIVDRDETKGLVIVELSVKSSTQEEVGQRGANARAVISKMVEGKSSTIPGMDRPVSSEVAVNTAYDIRERLGYMLTDGVAVAEPGKKKRQIQLSDEQLSRCTPEYQDAYRNNTVINGIPARENQAYFERSRLISSNDIDQFESKIEEQATRMYPGDDEASKSKREEYTTLAKHYLGKLRTELENNPDGVPLVRLREFMIDSIGEACDNTDPPTDVVIQSDLVSINFDARTGAPKISVARAEAVKKCIEAKLQASSDTTVGDLAGDRETSPELRDKKVGDIVDKECYDANGRMKWKCQFRLFVRPVWAIQARVSTKADETGRRRGGLQFKLNWAPPVNCTKQNSHSMGDYVSGK